MTTALRVPDEAEIKMLLGAVPHFAKHFRDCGEPEWFVEKTTIDQIQKTVDHMRENPTDFYHVDLMYIRKDPDDPSGSVTYGHASSGVAMTRSIIILESLRQEIDSVVQTLDLLQRLLYEMEREK